MSESEIPNLKVLRQERGWSQQFLADQLKVTAHTVMRWEAGSNSPQLKDVRKLAAFFDVSVAFLVGETMDRKPELRPVSEADKDRMRNAIMLSMERMRLLQTDLLDQVDRL
jgi:transcriptional regulator with XRE-family HTH domain